MATSDNKVEIKLITDYREFLLNKIETLKDSLSQVASSFGNELTSSIDEFSRKINGKLKVIDERFTKNTEELEAVRAELLSKKFDESNFNNVSMIRTLDKTIKERDLKIKELESRIRYLETNSNGNNATNSSASAANSANIVGNGNGNGNGKTKKETEAPIKQKQETVVATVPEPVVEAEPAITQEKEEKFKDAPRVKDANGDIVIAVSAKKPRSKTDKKKTSELTNVVQSDESSSATVEPAVEEKAKKPVRKIKKASKVEREEEPNVAPVPASVPVVEQINAKDVNEDNDAMEAQRLADEEALRLAQEEAEEAERIAEEQRMADEEAAEAERLEEERVAKEAAVAAAAEAEKKKKSEVVKKQVIGKKDNKNNKESSRESSVSKKITSKTVPAPTSTPAVLPQPATKSNPLPVKSKETTKVKPDYPDKLPDLEDLDVITVNDNDYYCDKNNQGVYQMINGDDIGIFLGYYDLETETITPVDAN